MVNVVNKDYYSTYGLISVNKINFRRKDRNIIRKCKIIIYYYLICHKINTEETKYAMLWRKPHFNMSTYRTKIKASKQKSREFLYSPFKTIYNVKLYIIVF